MKLIEENLYLVPEIPTEKLQVSNFVNSFRKENKKVFITFPHEWENKKDQILSHVRSYQNIKEAIYARKCEVKEIPINEVREFCSKYHIQGKNKLGLVGWGIFYNNNLLGILSLGRHHRNFDTIVLDRLCFLSNVRVVGGATKLFSLAIKWAVENKVDKIISFSDLRWSEGNVYDKLGFYIEETLKPDYFYVDKNNFSKYYSKQSQKKDNVNCPSNLTEEEWATQRGLVKVFDAGKIRWAYNIANIKSLKSFSSRRHGYYLSKKIDQLIYFQSSYELRAAVLLDQMDNVLTYRNQVNFSINGRKRILDFFVTYKDGSFSIIEVKPENKIEAFKLQIQDNKEYAEKNGWNFYIWSEKELGFDSYSELRKWADIIMSEIKDIDFVEQNKIKNREKGRRYYYSKIANDKVEVFCEFCNTTHFVLRRSYENNIKKNGNYICERYGGYIGGKSTIGKNIKINPYLNEGKKQCNKCKEIKLLTEFNNDKSKRDGLGTMCKKCNAEDSMKRYIERKNKQEPKEKKDDKKERLISFIEKAKQIHGDKYEYPNDGYVNFHTNLQIKCLTCNNIFNTTPNRHLIKKQGCRICGIKKRINPLKLNTEKFIDKSKEKWGNDYDYSITEYKTSKDKISFICKKHGEITQAVEMHLTSGCPFCVKERIIESNFKKFIEKSNIIHNNYYDYSKVIYKNINDDIIVICPEHGDFTIKPLNHTKYKQGCPSCKNKI